MALGGDTERDRREFRLDLAERSRLRERERDLERVRDRDELRDELR
jgi:hypothetical protein